MRRSLRFHLFGSALILAIPASYGLVAGLSHQGWSHGAAIGYLLICVAGVATGIPIAYRAHRVLTRSLQNIATALSELGQGRAARVNPASLPAELRELAQALNATSDILTALQHKLNDQSRRTALLTRLAIDLRASDDPPTIARGMLRLISLQSDACDAALVVVGPAGAIELAYTTTAGAPRPMPLEQARRELEHGPGGRVLRHSDSVLLSNGALDGRGDADGRAGPAGSAIALPLAHSQAIFGTLTISHPRAGHFTSQDLLLFEAVAAQASVALAAARLRLEERRRSEQALLLSICQSLTAERSSELLERAASAFDASATAIFLACEDSAALSCFASHGSSLAQCEAHAWQLPAHMAAAAEQAWQTGVPTSELVPAGAEQSQEHDRLACVALPLRHGGEAIGVFALARRARGVAVYSADTWAMLTLFGDMMAGLFARPRLSDHAREQAQAQEQATGEPDADLALGRDPLRVIFDHLPDGLVLLSAEGRILIANDAFCEDVLGLLPRAAIGQNYAAIIQELERGGQLTIESQLLVAAGRRARWIGGGARQRWYEIDRFVVADGEGAEQVIERWRDVTRQEERLRAQLPDEQPATMERLAAGVVHEIGNPLQSVRSCIDLSREDATLAGPTAEYLDLASSELRRMSQILGRLRDLYRLPSSEANNA